MKKNKITNIDQQNTTQKTKDGATWTPQTPVDSQVDRNGLDSIGFDICIIQICLFYSMYKHLEWC
jgi:hypothetical protein